MFVYLDNSSTTRQHDEVTEAMIRMMKVDFGNPSSLHRLGLTAEKAVKEARHQAALSLGVEAEEITFTSGGTESDNTALFGAVQARKHQGSHVITTQVEHPAILETCRRLEAMGTHVDYVGVDHNGSVRMDELVDKVNERTVLISVMHVNNEMGTIQPLREITALKERFPELLIHTDAVQSYGKVPIPMKGIDLLSVSGHKIHGPKGIGALYVKRGLSVPPFVYGGGQERGFRSGTENVPAIVGFGTAARLLREEWDRRITGLKQVREYLLAGIKSEIPDVKINGFEEGECCPSILNVSFLGCRGEVLLHTLEQSEIYVSTGSACSSNTKKKGSHVLAAAGLSPEEIEGAVRFGFSEDQTIEQMDYVLTRLKQAVESFRRLQKAFHGKKR